MSGWPCRHHIVFSSSEIVLEPISRGSGGRQPTLLKDQTITAQVLRAGTGRKVQLLINGKKITAKTFVPLKTGQTARLKVVRTGSQPVLKLVENQPGRAGTDFSNLLKTWGRSGPYGILGDLMQSTEAEQPHDPNRPSVEVLSKIKLLMRAMALQTDIPDHRLLRQLFQGSGLLWETRLAAALQGNQPLSAEMIQSLISSDIKALLLKAVSDPSERCCSRPYPIRRTCRIK
ncbi:MAG: hypothetical protein JRH15_12565 [Deltaproteobacteria bacterium]|nr:hypothetical protein [Deltaproteobacteria bacterium]